ncbi:protein containing Prepilin-type cleavage/methylation [Candidatus Magnetobacterium bavaricum]|uniref:Protein containing Prepilin-type cleavage/methylation n=1 Tax=Candidatus Magnetobacterium bavaricum TaxID=29290 RepID=A0A0F3GX05_9BACT|nr:protein containing Prepilin-type cleavage/methylation [Candidatus Magnetobacterium bavaricum]KJU86416.1 protein containing Prepilin-type cleavage/methylation [Candidatus Magnetobacterium bavaricum]
MRPLSPYHRPANCRVSTGTVATWNKRKSRLTPGAIPTSTSVRGCMVITTCFPTAPMARRAARARTRTSRAGILNDRGFTFLELAVVLFIVSVLAALTYPALRMSNRSPVAEARRFASALRYLNDTAINTKVLYELSIDLGSKQLRYKLPEGQRQVTLQYLERIYVSSRGDVREGQLLLPFGSMGLEEILKAWFTKDNETIIVSYDPYSRRVRVQKQGESVQQTVWYPSTNLPD